jgi:excinuclease ABC subunit C
MLKGLKSSDIPHKPGVYFFQNSLDKILYVGKAVNLNGRLGYYLRDGDQPAKIKQLLKEANSISWEIFGSEAEALIKEAEYIKKHHPKFNVLMRDDKQYLYVGLTKEKYPKVFITHQPATKKANYIGPFTESGILKSVLKSVRKNFPYCTCKTPHQTACLNAKLGKCPGYCCIINKDLSEYKKNYRKNIDSIKKILTGKNKSLAKKLKKEMQKLSKRRNYEEAGKIRDRISSLEKIFAHRHIVKRDQPSDTAKSLRALKNILNAKETSRIEAYDIANIQGKFAYGSMVVFSDGEPQKNEYRLFKIKTVENSNDPAMIKEVLERRLNHKEWPMPNIILIDGGRAQLNTVYRALHHKLSAKVIALTKNNKHKGDHIYLEKKLLPILLDSLPMHLKNLILRLDSEAHRFAIKNYRKLHRKSFS